MTLALTIIAIENIKTLIYGIPFRTRETRSPLSKGSSNINLLLQNLGKGKGIVRNGVLSYGLYLDIGAIKKHRFKIFMRFKELIPRCRKISRCSWKITKIIKRNPENLKHDTLPFGKEPSLQPNTPPEDVNNSNT